MCIFVFIDIRDLIIQAETVDQIEPMKKKIMEQPNTTTVSFEETPDESRICFKKRSGLKSKLLIHLVLIKIDEISAVLLFP